MAQVAIQDHNSACRSSRNPDVCLWLSPPPFSDLFNIACGVLVAVAVLAFRDQRFLPMHATRKDRPPSSDVTQGSVEQRIDSTGFVLYGGHVRTFCAGEASGKFFAGASFLGCRHTTDKS